MAPRLAEPQLRNESGFTLVELLVAMTLALIVLFGVLDVFDGFSSNAARQTRVTDANEHVRAAMDRIVSDLRHSRALEVADPNDLVYTVTDSATATRRERICLDSAGHLWRSSVTTTSPPETPIASGTACPTPSSGAFMIAPMRSANTASNPLFSYDSATPADVRNVGLTFALDAGSSARAHTSTLRASAFVRRQSERALGLDQDAITTTCSSTGVPTLTLEAGDGALSVTYTDLDGNVLGGSANGSATTLPSGSTKVVAIVTAESGATSEILEAIAC